MLDKTTERQEDWQRKTRTKYSRIQDSRQIAAFLEADEVFSFIKILTLFSGIFFCVFSSRLCQVIFNCVILQQLANVKLSFFIKKFFSVDLL